MHYFTFLKYSAICLFFVLVACEEQEPEHYIKEGKVLFEQGELESARVQFQNALQLNPRLSEAYFNLALIAEKKQNWGGMLRNLLDTVATDPAHLEGQIKLGQIYLLGGEFDKAVEQAKKVLKLAPENTAGRLLQAAVQLRQGKNKEAIQEIEHVLAQQAYFANAIALKVAYLINQDSKTEAYAVLNEGIKHNPDERDLRFLKIRIDIDNKRFDDAVREYENLRVLYPKETGLSVSQVDFLFSIGRLKEAELILREVIDKQPVRVELRLKLVELIEQRDDSEEVEKVLRESILALPSESVLKFRLVDHYLAKSQFLEAESVLQEIISLTENSVDGVTAKVKLAQIALLQKNKVKMERLVEDVLNVDANQTDALLLRAGIRLNKNDTDGAITDLRIVLGNRPDSEQALILLAQANVLKGEREVAESQWRKVLAINPNNMFAIMPLTNALFKRGEYDKAIQIYKEALNKKPDNPVALLALGQASHKAGQYDQLITYLETLLHKHPEVDTLYHTLAMAYASNEDWLEAENLLKRKLQQSAKDIKTYMLLALLYQNQGKALEAEKVYLAALDKVGENLQLMNELAKFYAFNKEFAKSIKLYEKIIEKYPDNNEAANNLADLLITHQGDNKKSEERALMLVERFQNSSNPVIQDTYGWVHLKSGNIEHAVMVLKKAVESMPEDARILYHLAEAYQQSGDSGAALIELEKSLSLVQQQGEFMEIASAKALKKQLDNNAGK